MNIVPIPCPSIKLTIISLGKFSNFFKIQSWRGISLTHSDLNDQNLFRSTIDTPPGVQGMSQNFDNQTEVHFGELER